MCLISTFFSTITVRAASDFFFFFFFASGLPSFHGSLDIFAMLASAVTCAPCTEWPFGQLVLPDLPQSELGTSGQSSTVLACQDGFIRIFIANLVHEISLASSLVTRLSHLSF